MKKWRGIVVHCSDSSWGTARDIDRWHKERGFSEIGYHFVIMNGYLHNDDQLEILDGSIERGRNLEKHGAHALNFNRTHIGICSISNGYYTEAQAKSLFNLVVELMERYNIDIDDVLGHNEVSHKKCPCFNVEVLRDALTYQDRDRFLEYMRNKDVLPKLEEAKDGV